MFLGGGAGYLTKARSGVETWKVINGPRHNPLRPPLHPSPTAPNGRPINRREFADRPLTLRSFSRRGSLFLVNIWQILAALAPNFGSIIVARALVGSPSSSPVHIGLRY